jgi:hypothetical protein
MVQDRIVIPPVGYLPDRRTTDVKSPCGPRTDSSPFTEEELANLAEGNRRQAELLVRRRVHIPAGARSERAEPLAKVIAKTASKMECTSAFLEVALTHLIEGIVVELCHGQSVTLAGFGRFGTKPLNPGRGGGANYAVPVFAPARGLRHEIRDCVAPGRESERALAKYRKRNTIGGVPGRESSRTCWTQHQRRKRLLAKHGGKVSQV